VSAAAFIGIETITDRNFPAAAAAIIFAALQLDQGF